MCVCVCASLVKMAFHGIYFPSHISVIVLRTARSRNFWFSMR